MADSVEQQTRLDIGGFSVPITQPDSVAEVQELVIKANTDGHAVYPFGGATRLGFGTTPNKPGVAVHLNRLANLIDYPARDMTITVEAGIGIARLRQILAEENQRLPIDVFQAEPATLGGAMAVNASGMRRYGCGTLRDYVIGITAINDDGEQIKAGGRVVKNVAGYDLCKLFIGSFGTLGILTQVTLKVVPVPDQHAVIVLQCAGDRLGELLEQLHKSQTRPVCIEAVNAAAAESLNRQYSLNLPKTDWLVFAGYESNADAVNWQIQQLIKELEGEYALEVCIGQTAEPVWSALTEHPGWNDAGLTVKASVPPSEIAEFCRQVASFTEEPMIQAHAGNGIALAHLSKDAPEPNAGEFVERFRKLAEKVKGAAVVHRCPGSLHTEHLIWGKPAASIAVMRAVKAKLDPKRLFNPGRFYGGI